MITTVGSLFAGVVVYEAAHLEGQKCALLFNGGLVVSPAVASLMRTEKGDDLERLLLSLVVNDLRQSNTPLLGFKELFQYSKSPPAARAERRSEDG